MIIDINEFLDLLTYNKLLEYVDMPSHVAAEILLCDPEHKVCFCEPTNAENVRVWYPVESWINECKRRKECESILIDCSKLHITTKPIERIEDIQSLIVKATIDRKWDEVNKLNERLQKLTK